MTAAKGESSSCCKGKEVATDDPLVKAEGGKALHFEFNHFEEEEGGRDPGSKCHPLIGLWYETHIHFLVVSSDYSPPSPGCVWLSLE